MSVNDEMLARCVQAGFRAAPDLGQYDSRPSSVDDFTRAVLDVYTEAMLQDISAALLEVIERAEDTLPGPASLANLTPIRGDLHGAEGLMQLPPDMGGDMPATREDERVRRGADAPKW